MRTSVNALLDLTSLFNKKLIEGVHGCIKRVYQEQGRPGKTAKLLIQYDQSL